jgi:hypothetical protein
VLISWSRYRRLYGVGKRNALPVLNFTAPAQGNPLPLALAARIMLYTCFNEAYRAEPISASTPT